MDLAAFRDYCLRKPGVTEEFPFNEDTLVFKVLGKMFALTDITTFEGINLKVLPERGVELREQYDAITPAFHMNKKHWITVVPSGPVNDRLLRSLIDDSYGLVVDGLPKSKKLSLNR